MQAGATGVDEPRWGLYNRVLWFVMDFSMRLGFGVVAALLWKLTHSYALLSVPLLLAAFFLWFFRDPDRQIPSEPGQIVSPGDGVVTEAEWIETVNGSRLRLSIFLNVFDVHVNRSPVGGTVKVVEFRKGSFLNAMKPESVLYNEQTLVVIDAGDYEVSYKQIAGLLARRIVCTVKEGDRVERGQRVGLIKFGSRVDVLMPAEANLKVKMGSRVIGGSTVLAVLPQMHWQGKSCGDGSGGLMDGHLSARAEDLQEGLDADGRKLKRRPSRGMYVLPSLFTCAQYCGRLLRDYAERAGIGDGPSSVRSSGAGDWVCGAVRRGGWAGGADDAVRRATLARSWIRWRT